MEKIRKACLILLIVGLVIIILSLSIFLPLAAPGGSYSWYLLIMPYCLIPGIILTIIGLVGLVISVLRKKK